MKTKMLKRVFAFTMSAFVLTSSADVTSAFAYANSNMEYAKDAETESEMLETVEETETSTEIVDIEETEETIDATETIEASETESDETEIVSTEGETEASESEKEENGEAETEIIEGESEAEVIESEINETETVTTENETEAVESTETLELFEEPTEGVDILSEEAFTEEMQLSTAATPGDGISTAGTIALNTTYSATITSLLQNHYYKYTLTKPGFVEVDFTNNYGGYYYLYLNPDGDDAEYKMSSSAEGTLKGCKIGLAAGTYYFRVKGSSGTVDKDYQFSLNFTPSTTCETESNDNFTTADVIPVNTEIAGTSHGGGFESDYYKFTLTAPGKVSLKFTHGESSAQYLYWVSLYNEVTEDAMFQVVSCGGDITLQSQAVGLPAGEYYVQVHGGNEEIGMYGLTVNYTQTNTWEKEVDDTYENANEMAVNTAYSGTLHDSSDVDYYKVTLDKDGMISLNFKHNNVAGKELKECYYVDIYRSGDYSNSIYRLKSTGGETNLTTPEIGLAKGTYYIKVSGYYFAQTTEPYEMKVKYTKSAYWEKETNDTFADATSIKADKTYKGSIRTTSDNDYYKVKVNNDGYVKIKLEHSATTAAGIYKVKLYDADYNLICERVAAGTENKFETCKIGLKKGSYYVQICNYEAYSGTYKLTVNATKASNWESELNNDTAHADKISVGKSVNGISTASNCDDYYKFTLSKASYINVSLEHEKISGTDNLWRIDIYDAKGNRIDYSASYRYVTESEAYAATKTTKLAKGTYYVEVSDYLGNALDMEYKLTVNKVEKKAPTISSVESTQYNKIKVSWKAVPGATKYEIYRADSKNGSYKKVKTISGGTTTSWTDSSVKTGKTYYYKMKSVVTTNKEQKSGYSKVKSAKCVPATPSVSLKSSTKKQMKISWKKVSGADGYEIYRATSKDGKYTKVTTIKKGSTKSYTDKKLTSGKTYYYKVRAYKTVNGKKVYSSYSKVQSKKVK